MDPMDLALGYMGSPEGGPPIWKPKTPGTYSVLWTGRCFFEKKIQKMFNFFEPLTFDPNNKKKMCKRLKR